MEHNSEIPLYTLIPFLLMLGSIAVLPLLTPHFWESNKNKLIISTVLSVPVILFLLFSGMATELIDVVVYDYLPFIILLGTLFVITGGIFIDGDIEAKPIINTTFLLIGAVLASFMGTTGAAMLLIRPLIQTNTERKFKVHTILFFIAIVANCGGLLTPLGDPPLFMMYLRGADFFWFFSMFKMWLFTNGILLILYFIVDKYYYSKEPPENIKFDKTNVKPIQISGLLNFVFLIGVVLTVAFVNPQTLEFLNSNRSYAFLREIILIILAVLSLVLTSKKLREKIQFSWEPIEEVAFLFIGIFITMAPVLDYLRVNAANLGITSPAQFYYAAGSLSSFLDNTPTAVTFYTLAKGLFAQSADVLSGTNVVAGIPELIMQAISLGAVFFGSMTYIGNGPNFMVKAIAEQQGIKMPYFFEYMYKFSLLVLLPIFILVHLLFI